MRRQSSPGVTGPICIVDLPVYPRFGRNAERGSGNPPSHRGEADLLVDMGPDVARRSMIAVARERQARHTRPKGEIAGVAADRVGGLLGRAGIDVT